MQRDGAITYAFRRAVTGLFAVGAIKTIVTNTNPVRSGLENLVIAGVGGFIAFYVGSLVEGALG